MSAGAWYFLTLPRETAEEIHACGKNYAKPGGSLRVTILLGHSRWQSSLFRDSGKETYLLPVKAAVRKKEQLQEGEMVEVTLLPAWESS